VGILFFVGAIRLGIYDELPRAGVFPALAAVSLIVLSFANMIFSLRGTDRQKKATEKFFPEQDSLKKVSLTVLALFVYVMALEPIGFLATTFLFMIFLLRFIEPQNWPKNLLISLLTVFFSYLVFVHFLSMRLPKGIFGF
jgi:putative tricarboxylic transport membrane protein